MKRADVTELHYIAPVANLESIMQRGIFSNTRTRRYARMSVANPEIPIAWVALAAIIDQITSERYHYPIGRVARQKIAYFATQAGVPTELVFEKRSYGPYAEESRRMFAALINNGLLKERKKGRMFKTTPGPTLRDAKARFASELSAWEVAIERVTDLFVRLPSTREAELVSTVHYIVEQLNERDRYKGETISLQEIFNQVRRWKDLSDEEIAGAIQTLAYLRWIDGRYLVEAAQLEPMEF